MKDAIIIFAVLLSSTSSSNAQVTLANSIPKIRGTEADFVNLAISGKKLMTFTYRGSGSGVHADTLYFYNLDYSLWKTIPCPAISGYEGIFDIYYENNVRGVFYPSETLFNLDPLLEVAVYYHHIGTSAGKYLIINENGVIVDSMLNGLAMYSGNFKVRKIDTLGIGYQAVFNTPTSIDIYNLPGILPCNTCGSAGAGETGMNEIENNFPTKAQPNPSSNEVKITFKLPEGAKEGELSLYNTNGQKINTYRVDNRFGYILLDNSKLPTGVYYYNIVVNGEVSSTQKLVLVK